VSGGGQSPSIVSEKLLTEGRGGSRRLTLYRFFLLCKKGGEEKKSVRGHASYNGLKRNKGLWVLNAVGKDGGDMPGQKKKS